MSDQQNAVFAAFQEAMAPPPVMLVSTWADNYRILSSSASSEPGPWRTRRTPYLAEPMENLSATSQIETTILMAGAQIGKSEGGLNWLGYTIDYDPAPMLAVQPTVDIAKRFSRQRLAALINESPRLTEKVGSNKSRDGGNSMLSKEFPGGIIMLAGANSAAGLRSMPIKKLFLDEVDAYPQDVDGEGDPVELAYARTRTFARRKILMTSTPTTKGQSRIEAAFLESDQRRFFVACPHCGNRDWMRWSNFSIPVDDEGTKKPWDAHMVCEANGCVIEEHHKTRMLEGGEWRPTAPENLSPKRRGYHLSSLYSPLGWMSWGEIADKWLRAKGNPAKLKEFINTVLAETWEEGGEQIDHTGLIERAEPYPAGVLPEGAVLLTAGVDVQHDRLELEIVAWGAGEETWSMDYLVLWGDPTTDTVWTLLDQHILHRTWVNPITGMQMRPARTFVDSSDQTARVYEYIKPREAHGVYAIKGSSQGEAVPLVGKPGKNNIGKVLLFPIGTIAAKDLIYGRLKIEEAGPGYCHLPNRYAPSYFEQLTSNKCVTRYHKGFAKREYVKDRWKRDEALDCRVYATAAFYSLGVSIEQLLAAQNAPAGRARGVRGESQ
jgi:phage terminase large subunit GpA-like protein